MFGADRPLRKQLILQCTRPHRNGRSTGTERKLLGRTLGCRPANRTDDLAARSHENANSGHTWTQPDQRNDVIVIRCPVSRTDPGASVDPLFIGVGVPGCAVLRAVLLYDFANRLPVARPLAALRERVKCLVMGEKFVRATGQIGKRN